MENATMAFPVTTVCRAVHVAATNKSAIAAKSSQVANIGR